MIAPPLNDRECLGKLTEVAVLGQRRQDLRDLAARFKTTAELAAWIRGLPQRDDDGDPADGPRVPCDVPQRARLVASDPNCVERSIAFVAAAELIDPGPVRQLATIDTPRGRHTFPIEDGEPVVLDPAIRRNGLRAGLWLIRNAGGEPPPELVASRMEPRRLLAWIADLAEDVAEDRDGAHGVARVDRSRKVFAALLDSRTVGARGRADALYALRLAGEAAPLYGETGLLGWANLPFLVSDMASPFFSFVFVGDGLRGLRHRDLRGGVRRGGLVLVLEPGLRVQGEPDHFEAGAHLAPPLGEGHRRVGTAGGAGEAGPATLDGDIQAAAVAAAVDPPGHRFIPVDRGAAARVREGVDDGGKCVLHRQRYAPEGGSSGFPP